MALNYHIETGNLMVCEVSGEYGQNEHQQILGAVQSAINKFGPVKLLVMLKDFEGWEEATGREEESGLLDLDENIAGFATVGDEKWRDQREMFTS